MHFNFETMEEVNPLKNLKFFYINPYMPDNFRLLGLDKMDVYGTSITEKGHFVIYFPISCLIKGNVQIKWKEANRFVINNRIYCNIVKNNVIRVDTIL